MRTTRCRHATRLDEARKESRYAPCRMSLDTLRCSREGVTREGVRGRGQVLHCDMAKQDLTPRTCVTPRTCACRCSHPSRLHAWSSAGKSGPRHPEHQKPSVAAGAARWGRFLERRGAELEGRCAQRTSSSFWPRLSERRERSERSEFGGPTLGRAPQGSRRVQRPTAPV